MADGGERLKMQSAGSKKLPVDDSDDDCVEADADSDSATAWNHSNITNE
ncbi:unnamed protein product [Calypogeia fissa]